MGNNTELSHKKRTVLDLVRYIENRSPIHSGVGTPNFTLFLGAGASITSGIISPALSTVLIGMGASMAYATPPAIAHVALAAGSGYCDSKDMLKYGGIVSIVSIVSVSIFGFIFGGIF